MHEVHIQWAGLLVIIIQNCVDSIANFGTQAQRQWTHLQWIGARRTITFAPQCIWWQEYYTIKGGSTAFQVVR